MKVVEFRVPKTRKTVRVPEVDADHFREKGWKELGSGEVDDDDSGSNDNEAELEKKYLEMAKDWNVFLSYASERTLNGDPIEVRQRKKKEIIADLIASDKEQKTEEGNG